MIRKKLTFRVYGKPRGAGSKRAFPHKTTGKIMVMDASKHATAWKQDVKDAALPVAPDRPITTAIALRVIFILPRPKGHYRTGKFAHLLKDSAPDMHTKQPDTTKLLRGTEDALTGLLWHDDNLVCRQVAEKRYGDRPGAIITIRWQEEEKGLFDH